MRDFLTDIADRSLTKTQDIRPRPLTIYEPLQATATTGYERQPEAEQVYRILTSEASRAVSMAPNAIATFELPAEHSETDTDTSQSVGIDISTAYADRESAALSPFDQPSGNDENSPDETQPPTSDASSTVDQPRQTVSKPVRQLTEPDTYRPAAMQTSPGKAPSTQPNVPSVETPSMPSADRRKSQRVSPDDRQTSSTSRPSAPVKRIKRAGREFENNDHQSMIAGTISERTVLIPAVERDEAENTIATQLPPQPVVPLHSPVEKTLEKRNEPMRKERATSTINVTIGRIEVRARPAQIRNQPEPRPPVVMSLDEYLRKCNGGG